VSETALINPTGTKKTNPMKTESQSPQIGSCKGEVATRIVAAASERNKVVRYQLDGTG